MNLLNFLWIAPFFQKNNLGLPTLLEAFPELKDMWPTWMYNRNGRISCIKDSDCPVPSVCCVHPVLPGEKHCCTGFGHRKQVKLAYLYNYIQPASGKSN